MTLYVAMIDEYDKTYDRIFAYKREFWGPVVPSQEPDTVMWWSDVLCCFPDTNCILQLPALKD